MRQEHLGLRSKQQRAIERAPVERLLAETIARNKQTFTLLVPQRKSEHPVEVLDHFAAVFLVQVRQDFGVRFTAEGVTARLQTGTQLAIVVDFAVENDGNGLIFVEGRLLAGQQIDNRQPTHS